MKVLSHGPWKKQLSSINIQLQKNCLLLPAFYLEEKKVKIGFNKFTTEKHVYDVKNIRWCQILKVNFFPPIMCQNSNFSHTSFFIGIKSLISDLFLHATQILISFFFFSFICFKIILNRRVEQGYAIKLIFLIVTFVNCFLCLYI